MVESQAVIFGMTRGELGLTAFVFGLVYAAALLPRLGERLGMFFVKRRTKARPSSGEDMRG
jgi:hypothetical protein